ncbi:sulfotransferase family protein [Sandaracinus amylolyticus]|uniref:sulfotransferase family protein n=1 Tax=Sandaracinus amylolyticus TaxID=927083 RepID=UPI001F31D38D|nr:sulfotransferase [Sandaracinus amylolyticus]UJR81102.1 Sulfotransferase [Sandaracinus amylolyticus]
MTSVQERLLFVVSPPRSGSTLLQRMIGSHSAVFTHPEPHLITPMAYLGFYDTVDKAPFDHINSAEAIRLFVSSLPRGEEDYLDALRAYSDAMYGRMLEPSGKRYFMDKTPAYALVLPFLTKLYPHAKYVVLTRHPLAIFSSFANSFFDGDWARAHEFNPLVERYVPAIAKMLRERPVPLVHVKYETLVEAPEAQMERVFAYMDVENEPEAVNYGERFRSKKGPGDPITVSQHSRPVTDSLHKWAAELAKDAKKRALAERMIERVSDEDLETWGWPRERVFDAVREVASSVEAPKPVVNAYTIQRKVMLALKKDIHQRPHGALVKRIRYYCDVLLRE